MFLGSVTPQPPLDRVVASTWLFERRDFEDETERVLPSGRPQILFGLAEATHLHEDEEGQVLRTGPRIVEGPRTRPIRIGTRQQRRVLGVTLRPGGLAALLHRPAPEFRDRIVDLDRHVPDADRMHEAILATDTPAEAFDQVERWLVSHFDPSLAPSRAIEKAIDALEQGEPVDDVADATGLSPRRFREHFLRVVGVPPKQWALLCRFQELLRMVRQEQAPDWASLAVACGYYDQAHMIRDFRRFAGLTPGSYSPRDHDDVNHVPGE